MEKLRVGYVCCARLTFDGAYARELMQRSLKSLVSLDIEMVHSDDLTVTEEDAVALAERFASERVDVVLIQYGTFALGSLVPVFADRLTVPVILWGVPEPSFDGPKLRSNSLCAINMNAHTLMRLGRKYEYLFCTPEEGPKQLAPTVAALGCLKRMHRTRVGLVGYRVAGFYPSTFDEVELRKRLGVEVYHVTLAELFDQAQHVAASRREAEAKALRASAKQCTADPEEIDKTAALTVAFQELAAKYNLGAYAVKCWPEFATYYGVTACGAMSRLDDSGILAACEGDVYGAVSMLIERDLSGQMPMFADLIAVEEDRNVALAWHCGAAAMSLADCQSPITLAKHSTVDGGGKKGVTVNFSVKGEGPVTMARLSVGPKGLRWFFAGGKAVAPRTHLPGNTWAICFDSPVRRLLDIVLGEGMEHHTAVVHADIRPELRKLAKWLDMETLDVDGQCNK